MGISDPRGSRGMFSKASSENQRAPRRRIGLFAILIFPLAILFAGAVGLAYLIYTLPLSARLQADPPVPSAMMTSKDGQLFATRGVFRNAKLEFDDLPEHLVQSVIAIEDRRFFQHFGIDPKGIFRAGVKNYNAGEIKEGASTITQQLAKLTFLSPEKSYKRKLQEILIAIWLESRLTKNEILSRYLAQAYFGSGVYGIDSAARVYFNKPVTDLSLYESALLAGLIQAPSLLNPLADLTASQERAAVVLNAMVRSGFINEKTAEEAKKEPLELAIDSKISSSANYFADWVYGQLRQSLGATSANLHIETTLDLRLQEIAEQTISRVLEKEGKNRQVSQASMVVMSPDGAVLAMIGGRDYQESQFNRAFQAQRQPGSLFKLFVYLAALSDGLDPETKVIDEPVEVDGWRPRNYGGRYVGTVSLQDAFARSINSIAVKLSQRVGTEKIVDLAKSLGIRSPLNPEPSLALGTSEVNLLEMTAAYAAVAANRKMVIPFGISTIGNLANLPESGPVGSATARNEIPPWPRTEILSMLVNTVRNGTARNSAIGIPSAGKTGTTQDYKDAWYVGFTPDLVVGVWVGNDDNSPMKKVTGGALPAKIWKEFVSAANKEIPLRKSGFNLAALQAGELKDQINDSEQRLAKKSSNVLGAPDQKQRQPKENAGDSRREKKGTRETGTILKGSPRVLDTAHLLFGGQVVALVGVEGQRGRYARDLAEYIGHRLVFCRPYNRKTYRCEVGGYDISEVVLFNGGGRRLPGAPAYLANAENHARRERLGIWGY